MSNTMESNCVEITPTLNCQKLLLNMPNRQANSSQNDTVADQGDVSMAPLDEVSVSSLSGDSEMGCTAESINQHRGVFFDKMSSVRLNTNLAYADGGKMWFSDLDFNYDIDGQGMGRIQDDCSQGTIRLMSLLNDAAAKYSEVNARTAD